MEQKQCFLPRLTCSGLLNCPAMVVTGLEVPGPGLLRYIWVYKYPEPASGALGFQVFWMLGGLPFHGFVLHHFLQYASTLNPEP